MHQLRRLVMLQRIVANRHARPKRPDTPAKTKAPGMPGALLFLFGAFGGDYLTGTSRLNAAAGTTPLGEWLSNRMICASRAR